MKKICDWNVFSSIGMTFVCPIVCATWCLILYHITWIFLLIGRLKYFNSFSKLCSFVIFVLNIFFSFTFKRNVDWNLTKLQGCFWIETNKLQINGQIYENCVGYVSPKKHSFCRNNKSGQFNCSDMELKQAEIPLDFLGWHSVWKCMRSSKKTFELFC